MIKFIKNLWLPEIEENEIAMKIQIQEMPAKTWWN
jgi:hypothetical protein